MSDLQPRVLRDTLNLLTQNTRPGSFQTIEYPVNGEYYKLPGVKKI